MQLTSDYWVGRTREAACPETGGPEARKRFSVSGLLVFRLWGARSIHGSAGQHFAALQVCLPEFPENLTEKAPLNTKPFWAGGADGLVSGFANSLKHY